MADGISPAGQIALIILGVLAVVAITAFGAKRLIRHNTRKISYSKQPESSAESQV